MTHEGCVTQKDDSKVELAVINVKSNFSDDEISEDLSMEFYAPRKETDEGKPYHLGEPGAHEGEPDHVDYRKYTNVVAISLLLIGCIILAIVLGVVATNKRNRDRKFKEMESLYSRESQRKDKELLLEQEAYQADKSKWSKLRFELVTAKAQIDDLKKKNSEDQGKLQEQIHKLERDVQEFETKLESREKEIATLEKQNRQLQLDMVKLEMRMEQAQRLLQKDSEDFFDPHSEIEDCLDGKNGSSTKNEDS